VEEREEERESDRERLRERESEKGWHYKAIPRPYFYAFLPFLPPLLFYSHSSFFPLPIALHVSLFSLIELRNHLPLKIMLFIVFRVRSILT
jgi:hypothetical protein